MANNVPPTAYNSPLCGERILDLEADVTESDSKGLSDRRLFGCRKKNSGRNSGECLSPQGFAAARASFTITTSDSARGVFTR